MYPLLKNKSLEEILEFTGLNIEKMMDLKKSMK